MKITSEQVFEDNISPFDRKISIHGIKPHELKLIKRSMIAYKGNMESGMYGKSKSELNDDLEYITINKWLEYFYQYNINDLH